MSRTSAKPSAERQAFLAEINADLPPDVDWKQGAIDYLRELVAQDGEHNTLYHLNKPFVGGPDFEPFYRDFGNFLATAQALDLPMRSSVLDVACGPGWVSHYFAKLGHRVHGIDISAELVDLARHRLDAEPFTTFVGEPLAVDFSVHDIEAAPLATDERFDVAYLESCLHHFYDPIAALDHIAASLEPDGRLCIIEALPSPPGSAEAEHMRQVMERYDTLERPFTREQFERLLDLAGFHHRRFYSRIQGLYENNASGLEQLGSALAEEPFHNLCIASREPFGDRAETVDEADDAITFLDGFYADEGDGAEILRWSGIESRFRLAAGVDAELTLVGHDLAARGGDQSIYIEQDGGAIEAVRLSAEQPHHTLRLGATEPTTIALASDSCFSPAWTGGEDRRLLSFLCRIRIL